MRKTPKPLVEPYCIARLDTGPGGGSYALFRIENLLVLSSDGHGWDHVRIRAEGRCPTWEEMSYIKNMFWDDEELVVQFHPPKSEYVNIDQYALHLWKPQNGRIELPPQWLVMSYCGPGRHRSMASLLLAMAYPPDLAT